METKKRNAILAGAAAVLVAGGGIAGWQIAEQRAEQAFIADQYAKLEADKAKVAEDSAPAFDAETARAECERLWRVSDAGRRFHEVDSVERRQTQHVTDSLYYVGLTITGSDGRKAVEANTSCSVMLADDKWEVGLS